MKPARLNRFFALAPVMVAGFAANVDAADLYWDANGNTTTATGGAGTWGTANTWRSGSSTGTLQTWADGNTAVFGGSTGNVVINSNVALDQLKITVGTTAGGYSVGSSGSGAIGFGSSYSASKPAIDGSLSGNATVAAKITGTISGGMIITHGSNITTPGTSGRMYLSNTASDFVGDITVLSGNLHLFSGAAGTATTSRLGNAANKVYLDGGAIFNSGNPGTNAWTRETIVESASGIGTNIAATGNQVNDLTGKFTGSGNLTRYTNLANSATAISEVRFSGDMSGYTGTIENAVPVISGAALAANSIMVIQTTATSGGAWKLSGGTMKLNTTDDTHIANGTGKGDLVINGGTLDLNGKSETINGLSGTGGIVQNQLAATASTLTLGDGDADASFAGALRDNAGTGGTLALTKIGDGVQSLGGSCSYTGATLVSAGTLLVNGALGNTAVTVANDARIGGHGAIGGSVHFDAGAEFVFSTSQTLTINGTAVTFGGFSIADLTGLSNSVADGVYTLIDGTATVSPANLANLGIENSQPLGNNKFAFFEIGSLKVHVIPEPGVAWLGGLGLLGLLRRRRA